MISGFFVRYGEVYVADICFSFFGFIINTLHCKLISLLLGDTTVFIFYLFILCHECLDMYMSVIVYINSV